MIGVHFVMSNEGVAMRVPRRCLADALAIPMIPQRSCVGGCRIEAQRAGWAAAIHLADLSHGVTETNEEAGIVVPRHGASRRGPPSWVASESAYVAELRS